MPTPGQAPGLQTVNQGDPNRDECLLWPTSQGTTGLSTCILVSSGHPAASKRPRSGLTFASREFLSSWVFLQCSKQVLKWWRGAVRPTPVD